MQKQSYRQVQMDERNVSDVLIERIIQLKKREEAAKRAVHFWGISFFVLIFAFFLVSWYNDSFAQLHLTTLLHALRNTFSLVVLSLVVICLGMISAAKKTYDKVEEEFERLREEIIDRQEQLWDTKERWDSRSALFSKMEQLYGINLFHK